MCACNKYCLKSSTEALPFLCQSNLSRFSCQQIMPTASFQAKLVIRLAESMLLTCLQRQGVLQFSKAQHFFPCSAAEFTKKEHLQNLLLIVHCCTDVVLVCFLLKMHSNLHFCFCRREKYSFFSRRPFLKIKCSEKFWCSFYG